MTSSRLVRATIDDYECRKLFKIDQSEGATGCKGMGVANEKVRGNGLFRGGLPGSA
jgi:hypothetical protein